MALTGPLKLVRNAALILVILAFLLFFGQPTSNSAGDGAVAEIDGKRIGRDLYLIYRADLAQGTRDQFPPDMDPEQINNQIDRQALENLIGREVAAIEAGRMGLTVSDEEFGRYLGDRPDLRDSQGRFSQDRVDRVWRNSRFPSERAFMDDLRQSLLLRKFSQLLARSVRVSDAQVKGLLERGRLRVTLNYAAARPAAFTDTLEISDGEVQSFIESEPERLAEAYQSRLDEFNQPEQVRVSHILFEGEDGRSRAEAVRARIVGGEDFATLATELSDDAGTRDKDGDLGFFTRGRMLAAFEESAFGQPVGEISPPVETERGIHLIRVNERRAAVERTLNDVQVELAEQLLKTQKGRDAALKAAEGLLSDIQSGASLASAAPGRGLEAAETSAFGFSDYAVPGLGPVPGLREAALELTDENPLPARVFSDGDDFFVISLASREAPDAATLAAELEPVRARIEDQSRGELWQATLDAGFERLNKAKKIERFPLFPGVVN